MCRLWAGWLTCIAIKLQVGEMGIQVGINMFVNRRVITTVSNNLVGAVGIRQIDVVFRAFDFRVAAESNNQQ